MSIKKNIYEIIGLTNQEMNECWNRDFMDPGEVVCPEVVLKDIISDKELSIEQKIYATWIYTCTRKKRLQLIEANGEAL